MKKLFVNEEACIGCGACVAIDDKHFDFNEDGLSEVISQEEIETDKCKNAIASCPTNAISYVEEENTNDECHCDNCTCENCDCTEDECHCEGCHGNDECNCDDDCECEGHDCKCDGNK